MKTITLLTVLLAFASPSRARVTETFKQTYPLAADGVVRLANVNGDIDISAWDKAEVSLEAVKRAKDDDELKRLEIVVEAQPARLSIKTKHVKKSGWSFFGDWSQGSVRYKLMVPEGARLEKVDSVNSAITVTGVHGPVNLDTVNGGITATGLMADARLVSVNGSLRAEFSSLEQVHEVKLASVNGRAILTLPKGASASIATSTVNGRSRINQPIKLSHSGKHHLAGTIGSGSGPTITLETVNGGIAVQER